MVAAMFKDSIGIGNLVEEVTILGVFAFSKVFLYNVIVSKLK